jgi:hypothetical protein
MPHEEDTIGTTMASLEQLDEKISDLAAMVARGFSEIRDEMATKDDIKELKEELKEELKDQIEALERKIDARITMLQEHQDAHATRIKDLEKTVLS